MRISDPLIGSQLGDYRIIDLLGRGGMARVYRGYDDRLERYAAVKVIDTTLSGEGEEEYRQRFQREARAIARLHHPCIVGVYQFGQVESLYYMAMAFVDGRDLGQILRDYAQQRRRMPYAEVIRIIGDIAAALDHAHAEGVIHRDVKPSNIMVKADGHAVLTDFGLALNLPEGSVGNTFGSAHYIAPEQAMSSADAVPQSDLYSLGIVLYQMLTGKVPFDDPSAMSIALKHMNEPPPPPSQRNPDLPPAVEAVVLRALEKAPADRYPTGKALIMALAEAVRTSRVATSSMSLPNGDGVASVDNATLLSTPMTRPVTSSTKPPTPSMPPRRPRRLWPLIGVMGVLAAVVAAILFTALPQGRPPAAPVETPPLTEGIGGTISASTDFPVQSRTHTPAAVVRAPTTTGTSTSTSTVTVAPTSSPTGVPTSTETASAMPTATPTATGTATPTPVSIAIEPTRADELPIGLYYDASTLVLINRSNHLVDLSGVEFAQRLPDGSELTFQSDLWRDAQALGPSNCFQVWTNRYTVLPPPLRCVERQGWRAVSYVRMFWTSERQDATFEVRRGQRVLAICRTDASSCDFDPGMRLFP